MASWWFAQPSVKSNSQPGSVLRVTSAASPALINTSFNLLTRTDKSNTEFVCQTFPFGTSDFLDHYISCLATGPSTKMFWHINPPHTTEHLSFWLFFCKIQTSETSTIWDRCRCCYADFSMCEQPLPLVVTRAELSGERYLSPPDSKYTHFQKCQTIPNMRGLSCEGWWWYQRPDAAGGKS